ncbi:hypothetical protein ACQRA4_06870 [Desulfovibrio sp. SGI.169]
MALGFIGTRTIASATERTTEAIQCALYWDRARRSALRDYPYSFATRRVALAEKSMPDAYAHEWRYAYALPDKCLKVHAVYGSGQRSGNRPPFRLESDAAGQLLLCDLSPAFAACSFDVEDISRWDELFVLAMAKKLAALIVVPLLKNNPDKVRELEQLYQMAVQKSEGQAASERAEKKSADGWLAMRGVW